MHRARSPSKTSNTKSCVVSAKETNRAKRGRAKQNRDASWLQSRLAFERRPSVGSVAEEQHEVAQLHDQQTIEHRVERAQRDPGFEAA
jgi:hypothetical protein